MAPAEPVPEDMPSGAEPPAEGIPGAAVPLLVDVSPGIVDGAGVDPGADPFGAMVEESPLVPGAVGICPPGCADWATAIPATPMLRLSPIRAMLSFCIVTLRKLPCPPVYAPIREWFRQSLARQARQRPCTARRCSLDVPW